MGAGEIRYYPLEMDKNMKERESNIELLRLVCMFLIIWIHFTGVSIFVLSEKYVNATGFESVVPRLIHGLCFCAVNTFILISGFFSIIPKAKSFFNLYLVCAFYAGLTYLIHLYQSGLPLNRWLIYNTLMPFGLWKTSTDWWFIPNYMILFILSPILNCVSNTITKRQFRMFLLLMAIPVFYFGWYRNMVWSEGGFNFVNFIFLYFIGRYIAIYGSDERMLKSKTSLFWIICWVCSGLLVGFTEWLVRHRSPSPPWMWYMCQYNSPLCLVSAVFLFMAFKSLRVKNRRLINWYAASCLSVYLVHNNAYNIIQPVYDVIQSTYDSQPSYIAYLLMFVLAIGLMVFIPLFDKLRILITHPICSVLCNLWYKHKSKVISAFHL